MNASWEYIIQYYPPDELVKPASERRLSTKSVYATNVTRASTKFFHDHMSPLSLSRSDILVLSVTPRIVLENWARRPREP